MAVDVELEPIVQLAAAVEQEPPTEETVGELRAAFAGLLAMLGAGDATVEADDHRVPGPAGEVPVRTYRPAGSGDAPLATLVWFHGGGWVIGDLDTHEALCRDLAAGSGCCVVAVDYRLAPEHRFPAAHDDAEAVVDWLLRHGERLGVDPARVAVGGDSAGGHLATVTARRLRDRAGADGGGAVCAQVLVYPVTDAAAGPDDHPSRREHAEGYLLTGQVMDFFTDTYIPDLDDRRLPDASPLRAADLTGLPPALVVVAGHDVLADEGLAYAKRLADAGVPTELEHLEGGIHLCAQMPTTAIGRGITERICTFLRSRLHQD